MSEVLRDSSPEGRIHLLLCGHEHYYARCLPHVPGYYHNPRHDVRDAGAADFDGVLEFEFDLSDPDNAVLTSVHFGQTIDMTLPPEKE